MLLVKLALVSVALAWGGAAQARGRPLVEARASARRKLSRSLLGEAWSGWRCCSPRPCSSTRSRRLPRRPRHRRRVRSQIVLYAISGGAGFLGLHLARTSWPRATRCARSTSSRSTIRSSATSTRSAATCATTRRARELVRRRRRRRPRGGGVADPRLAREIMSVNVDGTENAAARRARRRRRPRRLHLVDRRLRRAEGASARRGAPARRRRRRTASRRSRAKGCARVAARDVDHPAEDVPRPGAARRVRDPLRLDPRRPADLRARQGAQPLPAARRGGSRRRGRARVARAEGRGRGLQRRRDGVRHRSQRPRGADRARGHGVAPAPDPGEPAELALRGLELARSRRSANGTTRPRRRTRSSTSSKAERLLGWQPRSRTSRRSSRTTTGTREPRASGAAGVTHRVPWNQQALGLAEEACRDAVLDARRGRRAARPRRARRRARGRVRRPQRGRASMPQRVAAFSRAHGLLGVMPAYLPSARCSRRSS